MKTKADILNESKGQLPKRKVDMSPICIKEFGNKNPYEAMSVLVRDELITEEQFQEWYATHCDHCKFMSEVCMFGEV